MHMRQLSLLSMISRMPGSILHQHALNSFLTKSSSSWFKAVRDICLQYQLPHPLTLLNLTTPPTKDEFKKLYKKKVMSYWEIKLREEASKLESLSYFKPSYMSLLSPHPIFLSAGSSPYEVIRARVQAILLSGRYKTERLCRFWSKNPNGYCLTPSCIDSHVHEDVEHILLHCRSLSSTRTSLMEFTMKFSKKHPHLRDILLTFTTPQHPQFCQFLLDCSVIHEVINLYQKLGQDTLFQLFKVTRTWCYSLHRERLKKLGRWSNFS